MADLLIELLSEEIPARMQPRAAEDFRRLITEGLVGAGLTYRTATAAVTPRRLALAVEGVPDRSPDRRDERKGPKVGAPDKAIEGFLRSTGLSRDDLVARDTGKGQAWFAEVFVPGRPAEDIVSDVLTETVREFPWPKSMRWGSGNLRWVRPLEGILCILSDEAGARTVPVEIDGLRSGDSTVGHRFMAPEKFAVAGFDDYAEKLKRARVILAPGERADAIEADVSAQAFARGLRPVEDQGLLAEVAGLVEWPVVLIGEIGAEFLDLPPEVLRTAMKEHQKFFSLKAGDGRITHFATVANIETPDHGATILAGNAKVLKARLSDAKFFWENDLRIAREGMSLWREALDQVTFHARIGSQGERIERIKALARKIAPLAGADPDAAARAAGLAKLDLASEMVFEFPELQGVMGRYYSAEAGAEDAVAEAVRDHYHPLGPSDPVPDAPVSVALGLADRIDMLTGFWAIDEKPTGSKDPFALRRAALGVIRLILSNDLRVPLDRFIDAQLLRHEIDPGGPQEAALRDKLLAEVARHGVFGATVRALIDRIEGDAPEWIEAVTEHTPDTSDDLLRFIHDRLKVEFRERGIRHDVIDACLAMPGRDDLVLLARRVEALNAVLGTEDGMNLVQGFKRANNILEQAEEADGVEYTFGADLKFVEDETERALFAALKKARADIAPALEAEEFGAAMAALARLRGPIDAFFESVQVNADNAVVRRNRLNLLHEIREVCGSVVDLTRIEG